MSILTSKILRKITTFVVSQYKFYVDFKGMLYFQDSKEYIYPNAIKDKKFITQMYQNLIPTKVYLQNKLKQANSESSKTTSQQNQLKSLQKDLQKNREYPFVAQFWGQRNFLKCGIAPIIFNRIVSSDNIESIELSQEQKQLKFLEFSFGQYSVFDINKLCIDKEGRLWHPYLRMRLPKHKKNVNIEKANINIEKTNIMGVFSNELIAEMLDKISYQNNEVFLSQKGNKVKINEMPFDFQKSSLAKQTIL